MERGWSGKTRKKTENDRKALWGGQEKEEYGMFTKTKLNINTSTAAEVDQVKYLGVPIPVAGQSVNRYSTIMPEVYHPISYWL